MGNIRRDDADAQLVVDVAASLRRWRDVTGKQPPTKVLREAVWFFWQQPRLPRPLVASKYPEGALWSEDAARFALSGHSSKGKLVIEHLEPMNRALWWLIDEAPTVQTVIAMLPGRLACAVVTKEQSLALPDVGSPDERYAAAGLDLTTFQPLGDWRALIEGERVPIPAELADLAVGDTRWDAMGREWTVLEVRDNGAVIQHTDDSDPREFTWHGLMTLGARERPG